MALGNALIVAGLFFIVVATVGLFRFPDFYTRTHVVGKPDTLGGMLLLGGLAIHAGWSLDAVKLLLMLVFFGIANPVATHVLCRAAMKSGLQPWHKGEPNPSDPKAEASIGEAGEGPAGG